MNRPLPSIVPAVLAVTAFVTTLPLTRLALHGFPPLALTLGRLLGAALLAFVLLQWFVTRWPPRRHWPSLLRVTLGGVYGFPLLTAYALEHHAPAPIPLVLLPLLTGLLARWRGHERPAPRFWLGATLGSALVLHSGWANGVRTVAPELLVAALFAAIAYAEGGRRAHEMPGWEVMAWALMIGLPGAALGFGCSYSWAGLAFPSAPGRWLALAFLAAGVAQASQVQQLQPFLTLLLAMGLLGEPVPVSLWAHAGGVLLTVAYARRALKENP